METITLASSLTTAEVGELHERLNILLQAKQAVILDGSQVEWAATSILQMFVIFFKEAQQHGVEVKWEAPTDALCQCAKLLGVDAVLHLHKPR